MADNYLALRSMEKRQYYAEIPEGAGMELYAVRLVPVPTHEPWVGISEQYMVACITRYPQHDNAWGWVDMEPATRNQIGYDLIDYAREGWNPMTGWLYMVVRLPTVEEVAEAVALLAKKSEGTDDLPSD